MRQVWIACVLLACGNEKHEPPPVPPPPAPIRPTRIVFGDCAPPGTLFDSGPKPAPQILGHGAGFGPGSVTPALQLGKPSVLGDLDVAIIRRFIKRDVAKLVGCYERERLTKPQLAGEVKTTFTITATGTVADARATGLDPKVSACVQDVLSKIAFPKPKGSGIVKVEYPLVFQPPDRPTPPPTEPYVAGANNPLRDHGAALLACLAKPYGVGVVDLGPAVAVHGVDAPAAACIAKHAQTVTVADAQRCPFAYGVMPVADLPAVDVTGGLAALEGVLFARSGEVAIVGPIVLRAAPTTSMRTIHDLLMAAYAVNRPDIFVSTNAALPYPIELPAAPVPTTTGGSWADGRYVALGVGREGKHYVHGVEVTRDGVAAELAKHPHESIAVSADESLTVKDVLEVTAGLKVPWRIVVLPQ